MNFSPVLTIGGLPGWALLSRTFERQTDLFNKSPQIVRDTEYFEQNIGKITTARLPIALRMTVTNNCPKRLPLQTARSRARNSRVSAPKSPRNSGVGSLRSLSEIRIRPCVWP